MKWTFPNLRLFLSLAIITGGIYPLAVTLISLIFFPHQAHGSLIRNERGEIIASELIAQPFTSAKYFWPRPSAGGYATMPSAASNLSWTSGKLVRVVAERKTALLKAHNLPETTPVPEDMLFASGSGLEPFISPEAAEFQLNRVAAARGVPPEKIRELVAEHFVRGGILGENVINVMTLNAALDTLFPMSGM
ncbi:potassium-transporting ATPase subunit KdpC [Akkermansia sp.]|uniref:potassium-transporting ATPase subunit KdpC n=1 Tax=Akkermansia sp. TaxID=1872421 RepID=UPI003AB2E880